MSDQRFIIEMGMGNDQYGQDYTKAARRASRGEGYATPSPTCTHAPNAPSSR